MAEEEIGTEFLVSEDLIGDLRYYLEIPFRVSIEFGRKRMTVRDILNLSSDSIVAIPKSAGEYVEVLVNDKLIAYGEIITIEDSTGVVITDIANA